MFPPFLLAKLYVKGSLKNTETGFQFSIKNIIDAATLAGVNLVSVGEKNYEASAITLTFGDKSINGADLSRTNSIQVRMGMPFTVAVSGEPLAAGAQKISLTAMISEIGKIKIDITDTVV